MVRGTALVTAVLVVALLLVAAIARLPPIQRWAAEQVATRFPPGISLDRVALTVLPPGVRLTNVAFASGGPTLKSVSCRLRVAALLAGRFEVAAVAVDGAVVTVERAADGSFHLTGKPAPPPSAPAGSPSAQQPPAPPPAALPAVLPSALPAATVRNADVTFLDRTVPGTPHALRLSDGTITLQPGPDGSMALTLAAHFDPTGRLSARGSVRPVAGTDGSPVDRAIDASVTAERIDAQTLLSYLTAATTGSATTRANGALDGSLTLSGSLATGLTGDAALVQPSGSLDWDQVGSTAPLKLSAHLTASQHGIELSDGHLTIAQLAAARVSASDLDVAFAYGRRALRIAALRATAYGGTWTQQGTVLMTDPPNFDITLGAGGVQCEALLAAVTVEHPQFGCERLSADAAVLGEWTGARSVARGAEGTGHIEMRGGTIPSSSIIGAVWKALVPLIHTGADADPIGAPTRVDNLTLSFALRAGRMHTTDLSLVTDDYTITGTGSIGLDGTLNLDTEVAMTPAGVTKLLTMAALPIPGDPHSLPSIPTRITGSVGDPIIRPEVGGLPKAAVETLVRGAWGATQEVEDAAGKGVQGLRRGIEKLW